MTWRSGGPSRTSTTIHRRWRKAVLDRAGWRCEIRGPGCVGYATNADHIVNIKAGGHPYAVDNGQAACAVCHSGKTQAEAAAGYRAWRARTGRAPRPTEPHPGEGADISPGA